MLTECSSVMAQSHESLLTLLISKKRTARGREPFRCCCVLRSQPGWVWGGGSQETVGDKPFVQRIKSALFSVNESWRMRSWEKSLLIENHIWPFVPDSSLPFSLINHIFHCSPLLGNSSTITFPAAQSPAVPSCKMVWAVSGGYIHGAPSTSPGTR